jgi:hypothetical protein
MSEEKEEIKINFCEKPGKSPTPAPPTNQSEPTPNKNKNVVGLPHEPRRNGRSICQVNACRQHLEPPANQQQQDNILRPIIKIMLKALSMFMFW